MGWTRPDVCHCNAAGRLATHRQLRGAVRGGPRMEAAYIVLPPGAGGKSMAVAIEKQAILALQARTTRLCPKKTGCVCARPRVLRAPVRVPWCQTQMRANVAAPCRQGLCTPGCCPMVCFTTLLRVSDAGTDLVGGLAGGKFPADRCGRRPAAPGATAGLCRIAAGRLAATACLDSAHALGPFLAALLHAVRVL